MGTVTRDSENFYTCSSEGMTPEEAAREREMSIVVTVRGSQA